MDIRSRIMKGRLIEKMNRDPEFSKVLGLKDRTRFCDVPLQQPFHHERKKESGTVTVNDEMAQPDRITICPKDE